MTCIAPTPVGGILGHSVQDSGRPRRDGGPRAAPVAASPAAAAAADEAERPSGAASVEGAPAGRGLSDGVRELLLEEEEEQAPDDEPEEEGERLLRRDERRRRLRDIFI